MRKTQNKARFIHAPTTHELRKAIRYGFNSHGSYFQYHCKQIIWRRNFGTYNLHTINPELGLLKVKEYRYAKLKEGGETIWIVTRDENYDEGLVDIMIDDLQGDTLVCLVPESDLNFVTQKDYNERIAELRKWNDMNFGVDYFS